MMQEVATKPVFVLMLSLSVIEGRWVNAHVRTCNQSSAPAYLLKKFAEKNSGEFGDWFKVYANGKKVEFSGKIIKRGPPSDTDFVDLPPGSCADADFILNHAYDIPVGAELTVQFATFNPSRGDQGLQKLNSDVGRIAASL